MPYSEAEMDDTVGYLLGRVVPLTQRADKGSKRSLNPT